MTKLVTFLGRKPVSATEKPSTSQPEKSEIELDHELFFPIATQLGQENEAVRNLLIDAEHKIGELETIKRSIGNLVDPVSKTLRAFEEAKSEKLSLQGVLNNTRIAHNKLRDDLGVAEKKAATFESENVRLREIVSVAQQSVAALERTKTEHIAELTARRTHIAELQRHVQQQGADLQTTREENSRLGERIATADKRTVQLEGETHAAQQKAMQSAKERAAVQASLDKALNEFAQTARQLTETEKTLASTQARLKVAETSLAETQAERTRLSAALDEAKHKHVDEMNLQMSRFQALQARTGLTESLLEEARQTLIARADEIRSFERRVIESSSAHGDTNEKLGRIAADLAEREMRIKDLEHAHAAASQHNQMLGNAVAARESAYARSQQQAKEQADLVALLEEQLKAQGIANEMQIEQLNAQLQRERLERTMAEGALESGRKDIARLLREIGALQYRPNPMPTGTSVPTVQTGPVANDRRAA